MSDYSEIVESDRCTCACVPTQYEGTLWDGQRFYFRYRFGRAMLGIGATEDQAVGDTLPPSRVLTIGHRYDGDMDRATYEATFLRLYHGETEQGC